MTSDRQETVSIEHEGILISGQVRWKAKVLTVTITSPYQLMRSSTELKWFAPRSFEEPAMREPAAKRALLRCYQECKAVECHWHEMTTVMNELEMKLVFGHGINALLGERRELRKQRHDGVLTVKQYDSQLRGWESRRRAAHTLKSAFIFEFLRERLPADLSEVLCSYYWLEKMRHTPKEFGINITPRDSVE